MEQATIAVRRIGDALVLTLPAVLDEAGLAAALESADSTAAKRLVLDLRGGGPVPVRTARTLLDFARAVTARGVACVLLCHPADRATRLVLDGADPAASVPRATTLDHALGVTRPPANSLVFGSADLGRTEAFLSTLYAPLRITGSAGRTSARVSRVEAAGLSADLLDVSFDLRYDVEPLGGISLCAIDSGAVTEHRVDGWRTGDAFGPGQVFALAPPDRPFSGRIREARYGVTTFPPELLDRVAGTGEPVRLLDHRPHDPTAARQLKAALTHLREEVLAVPEIRGNPLVIATASHYLAACVLNAFPNTAQPGHPSEPLRDAHPRTLRRAIAYIEANADRDIGTADIAAAAHVSGRAVQLAFRRHLGITPMAYLRRVRLDCAREELLAGTPDRTTVTRVAARWGYTRPSHFAAHYRAVYGESPSQTLRG